MCSASALWCRSRRFALLVWLACGFACGAADRPGGGCESLNFEISRKDVDAKGQGTASVTIQPQDVTLGNLVCVADRLQREHPEWTEIRVAIFDSAKAAEDYRFDWQSVGTIVPPTRELEYERLRRAVYVASQSTRTRYLQLRLFGVDDTRYQTRLDLPIKERPNCSFAINGRCLLLAEAPLYPQVGQEPISGSVTVTAEAGRDGSFTKLKLGTVTASPVGSADVLGKAAIDNLRTWRIDHADQDDVVTVRYTFVTDVGSAPNGTATALARIRPTPTVEMSSPNEVTVRQRVWR